MVKRQAETEYKWLEAAESCEQALQLKPESSSSAANVWRKIGFFYGLASRQAETVLEFSRLRQLAVESYRNGARLFEEDSSLVDQGNAAGHPCR